MDMHGYGQLDTSILPTPISMYVYYGDGFVPFLWLKRKSHIRQQQYGPGWSKATLGRIGSLWFESSYGKLLKSIRGLEADLPQLHNLLLGWKAIILSCVSLAFIYHTYLLGLKHSSSWTGSALNWEANERRKQCKYYTLSWMYAVQCGSFYWWLGNADMITFVLCPLWSGLGINVEES